MCGIFGFVSEGDREPNLKRLERIARATERRGPHAFGFAWIDGRGRLRSYKQSGRITDHLGLLAMAADARMLIGHCRYATAGDPDNNLNNHPHPCDGGWFIHNGVVDDYDGLVDDYDLHAVTECDSESIGLLIEQFDGSVLSRCVDAVNLLTTPAAFMGLWGHPGRGRMVVARRGKPLHSGREATGIYLASLPGGLPKSAKPVADGSAVLFSHDRQGGCKIQTVETEPPDAVEPPAKPKRRRIVTASEHGSRVRAAVARRGPGELAGPVRLC